MQQCSSLQNAYVGNAIEICVYFVDNNLFLN